jgi:large subunit ribosomal protein L29
MKASELRNKTGKELKDELLAKLKELFNLRTQKSIGQTTQTHQFKVVKRAIARIKTVLCEKEGASL